MDLPEIAPAVRERLVAEFRRWGRILIPAIVDEFDHVVDGELLLELAAEAGIRDVPRAIIKGLSDSDKADLRCVMDAYRRECGRQLSQEEKRQWITLELACHPHYSDRQIADWIGCSPTTVGEMRAHVQFGHVSSRLGRDGKSYHYSVVHTETERQRRQAQRMLKELDETPTDIHMSMRNLRHLRWGNSGPRIGRRHVPSPSRISPCI